MVAGILQNCPNLAVLALRGMGPQNYVMAIESPGWAQLDVVQVIVFLQIRRQLRVIRRSG